MDDFLRDINYMIYIRYVYGSFDNISYHENEFGIRMSDKNSHCSFCFTHDKIVEFKRDNETPYYLHFEFITMNHALKLFRDFLSYIEIKKEIKVLLSCTSALTSSYLSHLLNKYSEKYNENIEFSYCSYFDLDKIYKKYDYVLLAPQLSYIKTNFAHIHNLHVISTNDYATYNCYKIIEFVKKKVEP